MMVRVVVSTKDRFSFFFFLRFSVFQFLRILGAWKLCCRREVSAFFSAEEGT